MPVLPSASSASSASSDASARAPHHTAPDPALIERFDVAGPRYTSYPTADRFVEAFGAPEYGRWLDHRAQSPVPTPLSLYVHIPFCQSVCWYCACNQIGTRDRSRGDVYVDDLLRELALYTDRIGTGQPVSQMHWGGGTPTFLMPQALERLMQGIERAVRFTPQAERSIEVDPRSVDSADLHRLRALGFNRLSFGVQDFDPTVQQAVHRVQSTQQVFELTRAARALAFESVNVDLIHGLPHQTPERFAQTLDTVAELRPDRIAVYGYAHLPQRFKPQRRIHEADLPSAGDKLAMMQSAIERLGARGYVHIGLDHFALPDDALAVAQRMGVLHRNFMGYTTQPDCDMIGLGVSAIGRIGPSYGQNARMLETWQASVRAGVLPIERGCELSREDMLRRFVIMSMMCNGTIPFAAVERDYLVSAQQVFRDELAGLREFEALGLVRIDADGVTATTLGRFFVRPIAMLFDRALRSALPRGQYCRVL